MTQDEIIRMAREAGLKGLYIGTGFGVPDELERFAALVAEATKEKAAKVCELKSEMWYDTSGYLRDCAAAIRGMK